MALENSRSLLMRPGMDRILGLLSKRQRRQILFALNKERVENESDVVTRDSDAEKVRLELRHNHLPRLEEAGYIEWDRDTGRISKGPRFQEIQPFLELLENHADELPPDWP